MNEHNAGNVFSTFDVVFRLMRALYIVQMCLFTILPVHPSQTRRRDSESISVAVSLWSTDCCLLIESQRLKTKAGGIS